MSNLVEACGRVEAHDAEDHEAYPETAYHVWQPRVVYSHLCVGSDAWGVGFGVKGLVFGARGLGFGV